MTYEQYREIFHIIDDYLWEIITERKSDGSLRSLDARLDKISQRCEESKKILSEYIDRSSERMRRMVTSEPFRRFPMPTAPTPQRTQSDRNLSLLSTVALLSAIEAAQASDAPLE